MPRWGVPKSGWRRREGQGPGDAGTWGSSEFKSGVAIHASAFGRAVANWQAAIRKEIGGDATFSFEVRADELVLAVSPLGLRGARRVSGVLPRGDPGRRRRRREGAGSLG